MAEIDYDREDDLDSPLEDIQPTPEPQGFFTRRRIFLFIGIVGFIFTLSFVLFGMRTKKADPTEGPLNAKVKQTESSGGWFSSLFGKSDSNDASGKAKKNKNRKIKYVKLYELDAAQAANALKELSLANISFSTEQKGKNFAILVDEKELEEAKNILAIKGLPGGSAKGYELLDASQTLGVTEFDKRIRFIRALSGELEKAILQFEMIENCKVQIVLPEQRLFAVTQPPVTASILIRKRPGFEITDDVVFSIIQLVANAVENLQPENVSVIDTEGKVLSSGIFERIAAKEAGIARPKPVVPIEAQEDTDVKAGTPIVPDFEEIQQWQNVKAKFEQELNDKATDQLNGILPQGSFKVAISADIGPLQNGEIVDIKRLTTSIVVDSNRNDIFLDPLLKKQIFTTVASAIGYVKGRDTIQLSKAAFKMEETAKKKQTKQSSQWFKLIKPYLKYIPFALGGLAGLATLIWLVRFIKSKVQSFQQSLDFEDSEEVAEDDESDFSGLQKELSGDKQIQDVQALAQSDPEHIAQIIEDWLQQSPEEEA